MIEKATYLYDFLFEVTFDDNTTRVVDLANFFAQKHPLIRRFAKPELAKNFYIEDGTLCWGDNECDINPHYIYAGRYDAKPEYA